jgi:7-carboxy-7-deazaguanine synthase
MFGQNPIRSQEHSDRLLAVEDAFYTIQGEGPFVMPAVFIRMAGCNLACTFCDTQFETRAEVKENVSVIMANMVQEFSKRQREFVVITGGEPLRQDISTLAEMLYAHGTRHIQIETAGTLWVPGLEKFIERGILTLVCSPKTPKVHPEIAERCKHWKYVVRAGETDEATGIPNRGTQRGNAGVVKTLFTPWWVSNNAARVGVGREHFGTVWLSPCDDYDAERNLANMHHARDLCLKHGYRISLQVHKIIGVA